MAKEVSLGVAWPNKGFVGLHQAYGGVLRRAMQLPVKDPEEEKPEPGEIYKEKLSEWADLGAECLVPGVVLSSGLPVVPARRLFTISDIWFHSNDPDAHVEVRPKDFVWRWPYHDSAFALYWALLFHLSVEDFSQEEKSRAELMGLLRFLHPEISDVRNSAYQYLLCALYERTIGAEADAIARRDHYVKLILNRRGVLKSDRGKLLIAFNQFLSFMKDWLEGEIVQ